MATLAERFPLVVSLERDDQLYVNESVVYTADTPVKLRIDYFGPADSKEAVSEK